MINSEAQNLTLFKKMKKETMKIEALVSVTQFLIPREVIEVVNPAQEKKTTIHHSLKIPPAEIVKTINSVITKGKTTT